MKQYIKNIMDQNLQLVLQLILRFYKQRIIVIKLECKQIIF